MQLTEKQKSEGWRIVKFGEIAKSVSKRVDPADTDLEVYVGLEHLDPDNLRITRRGVPSDVKGQKLLVKPGQIIFGKRRAYQRKVAVADFEGICSAHAMVLEAIPEAVVPQYLPFFMQSDMFMERAVAISEGSLSPTIKWKTLANQEFPLPPRPRQEEVLEVLTTVEQCLKRNAEAFERAVRINEVHAAHSFSLNNKNRKYKKLKEFAAPKGLQTGPFGSQLHAKDYSETGIPVIMPKDIENGKIFKNEAAKVSDSIRDRLEKHVSQMGDFLFGRRGDIGRFGYVDENNVGVICGTGCLRFRPKDKDLSYFFKSYFKSKIAQRWLNTHAVGMTMLNLNTTILGNMPVPVLSDKELEQVIQFQEQIEQTILEMNKKIDIAKKLRNKITSHIWEAA